MDDAPFAVPGDGCASEHLISRLLKLSPDLIAYYDPALRLAYANPKHEEITGLTATHHPGNLLEGVNDSTDTVKACLQRALASGEAQELDYQLRSAGGETLWYSLRVAVERDAAGRVAGLATFARDITERRRAEALLRERERQLHTLLENFPDHLLRYDRECRVQYVNDALRQTFPDADQWLGKSPTQALPEAMEGMRELERRLHRVMASGATEEFEIPWVAPGGEPRNSHVILVAERQGDGSITSAIAAGRDVTALKQHDALLRLQAETELRLSRLTEMAPGAFYTCLQAPDGTCKYPYVSPRYTEMMGLQPHEVADDASAALSLLHPDDLPRHMDSIAASQRTLSPWRNEFRIRHPLRGEVWLEARATPERQADGGVLWYGFMLDISAHKRLEAAWRFVSERGWGKDGEAFFPALVRYLGETFGVDYVVVDRLADDPGIAETIALYAKGELLPNMRYALHDTPCESVMGRSLCCYPQGVRERFPNDTMLVDMGVDSYVGIPLLDTNGTALGLIAVMDGKPFADAESITDVLRLVAARASAELIRERSDHVLRAREREFRTLVEQSPDYIVRYNLSAERLYINPRLQQLTAAQPLRLGAPPMQGSNLVDAAHYQRLIDEVLATGEPRSSELRAHHPNGHDSLWLDIRICPELDEEGRVQSVFAIGRDITESVHLREKIHSQALADPLTHLANRQALYERGPALIAEAKRYGCRLGVMILDLDGFKQVNDSMGHSAGDQLLRDIAQRLSQCVRSHDLLVRLGGDEFAIVTSNIDKDFDLAVVAARVCNMLAAPLPIGGRPVFVTASIGIALFPEDGADLEQLLSRADIAMYHAKHSGRNRFEFHRPEFTARAQRRLAIEEALRETQHGAGLELYFQPKVRLADGALAGAEALLRWRHPELGPIAPDDFIPIAEDTGLIVPIGRWVLQAAAETAVRWNRGRRTPLRLAVNVSTTQFVRDDLLAAIRDTLARTGCSPAWLEIEVTESLLLEDDDLVRQTLHALTGLGVSVAIDDFGTGYSALSYLTKFDVDCLKIDRQFVHGVEHDQRQRELLKAFIAIAKALGMEVVAEGVETAAQAHFLLEQDCQFAQGYLYSAPLPAERFEDAWLPALVSPAAH